MPLQLEWKSGSAGELRSKWWYGRIMVAGSYKRFNLGVVVKGKPPASNRLRDSGDRSFETSRAEAAAALSKLQLDTKKHGNAEELVQRLHELQTGDRIETVGLNEMAEKWLLRTRIDREKSYTKQALSTLKTFVEFMAREAPKATHMCDVRQVHVDAWLTEISKNGISGKTYNDKVILLRGVFRVLAVQAAISKNPFEGIRSRLRETISRRPFEVDDLTAIIAAAEKDDFIGPIVICALSTALRRGDCCMLRWGAVDLDAKLISLQPSKSKHLNNNRAVAIPIFPLFEKVLLTQRKSATQPEENDYVFPEQAKMYRLSPDGITLRIQRLLKQVGFAGDEGDEKAKKGDRGAVRIVREPGMRRVSIRGAHSFRATWVTLALMAGVPMDVVRRVTGHATVEVVLNHYFSPAAASLRKELEQKLPTILKGHDVPKKEPDEVEKLLSLISDEAVRTRLTELIVSLQNKT